MRLCAQNVYVVTSDYQVRKGGKRSRLFERLPCESAKMQRVIYRILRVYVSRPILKRTAFIWLIRRYNFNLFYMTRTCIILLI